MEPIRLPRIMGVENEKDQNYTWIRICWDGRNMTWKRFDQETPAHGQFIVAVKVVELGVIASTATTYLEDGDMDNGDWRKYFTYWMPLPKLPNNLGNRD